MKSPFAILLIIAILFGIGIGIAAIVFFAPGDTDSKDTIPIASESDLPTPSTRNEALSGESSQGSTRVETTESDESSQTNISSDEVSAVWSTQIDTTQSVDVGGAGPEGQRAQSGIGNGGPGEGGFQAIQDAIADNPELAELFQKAQSGSITEAEQARMQELMQEVFSEAGIGIPDGRGGGFGNAPTQGTISAISGSELTIDHSDGSGISTNVKVNEDTNINVVRELEVTDLTVGANVFGSVQRGEGGRIFIVNLTLLPQQSGQAQGVGGIFRGGFELGNDSNATNVSNINGTVSEINDQTVSVDTTQGTLRLAANEDTVITSTSSGALSDLSEGMSAIAIGPMDDDGMQARNVIAGPVSIIGAVDDAGGGFLRGTGRGGRGQ